MIKPNKTDTTSDRAKKMLRAFLLSRAPCAVSLCEFTEEGLLIREWLDDFINTYREALEPPRVPENAQTEMPIPAWHSVIWGKPDGIWIW
jgi:hypothetical protein